MRENMDVVVAQECEDISGFVGGCAVMKKSPLGVSLASPQVCTSLMEGILESGQNPEINLYSYADSIGDKLMVDTSTAVNECHQHHFLGHVLDPGLLRSLLAWSYPLHGRSFAAWIPIKEPAFIFRNHMSHRIPPQPEACQGTTCAIHSPLLFTIS